MIENHIKVYRTSTRKNNASIQNRISYRLELKFTKYLNATPKNMNMKNIKNQIKQISIVFRQISDFLHIFYLLRLIMFSTSTDTLSVSAVNLAEVNGVVALIDIVIL